VEIDPDGIVPAAVESHSVDDRVKKKTLPIVFAGPADPETEDQM
jgi:hypothetical protein